MIVLKRVLKRVPRLCDELRSATTPIMSTKKCGVNELNKSARRKQNSTTSTAGTSVRSTKMRTHLFCRFGFHAFITRGYWAGICARCGKSDLNKIKYLWKSS